jgi:S1-C subfamily serine protease
LYPITLGDSTRLKVGQLVFAIGNPFGLERTLTTGIISSLNRSLQTRNDRTIKSIIQTDAAINPGNSGGPLLDSHSRLIGMNTAIASRTGQNTGVGFAIPASTIGRVVPELIEKGRVNRPDIGVQLAQTDKGAIVVRVAPGGPAEKAGLQGIKLIVDKQQQGAMVIQTQRLDATAADTIIAVDGQKVRTIDQVFTLIESRQPGEEVTLTVLRGGKPVDVAVKLAAPES